MKRLACFLAMSASSAFADGLGDYDPTVLAACISDQVTVADQAQCIGVGAAICLDTDAGSDTVGQYHCFEQELGDWDQRLNAAYGRLLNSQAELRDETEGSSENLSDPIEKLRAMQRAWIVYRDATCEWEWRQWGSGTGGGPAAAECLMRLTAKQSIFLEMHL